MQGFHAVFTLCPKNRICFEQLRKKNCCCKFWWTEVIYITLAVFNLGNKTETQSWVLPFCACWWHKHGQSQHFVFPSFIGRERPAWLHPEELGFKQEKPCCCRSTDRTPQRSTQREILCSFSMGWGHLAPFISVPLHPTIDLYVWKYIFIHLILISIVLKSCESM